MFKEWKNKFTFKSKFFEFSIWTNHTFHSLTSLNKKKIREKNDFHSITSFNEKKRKKEKKLKFNRNRLYFLFIFWHTCLEAFALSSLLHRYIGKLDEVERYFYPCLSWFQKLQASILYWVNRLNDIISRINGLTPFSPFLFLSVYLHFTISVYTLSRALGMFE